MDARSKKNLEGVHPDLVGVIERVFIALESRDDRLGAVVIEGRRSTLRQSQLVKVGASRTMNSRHITGHAVDLAASVAGDIRFDWPLYLRLAEVVRECAQSVPVVWGGTWKPIAQLPASPTMAMLSKSFPDGPHFELDRLAYPG